MKSAISITILSSLLPLALSNCQSKPLTIAATPSLPKPTIESSTPSLNPSLSKSSNALALDAYTHLAQENPQNNLFFSPLSISSALWMTYSGARAETATEMSQVLQLTQPAAKLEQDYQAFITGLSKQQQGENAPQLNIANGLCLTGGGISQDYQTLLKNSYEAEVFTGDVQKINQWVSEKTQAKIPKLIEQLPPNSAAVILNAIYFKGTWVNPFQEEATQEKAFTTSQGKVEVPMMSQFDYFRLLETEEFQLISLPYQDSSLSLQVLLPKEGKTLTELEKQLQAEKLQAWQAKLQKQPETLVDLQLPKLKLETKYGLNTPLQKLGMNQAFDPARADFSGMGGQPGELWIDAVVHKAYLEIDEEGTKAAAVTGVIPLAEGEFIPPKPKIFHANRPFLFWIQDDKTGTLLFLGRYQKPTKS